MFDSLISIVCLFGNKTIDAQCGAAGQPRNNALYQNIKQSYEQNIRNADFDSLSADVDRHMSAALCSTINDVNIYKHTLFRTKFAVPALAPTIDQVLNNVTDVCDNAVRRYKFFTQNLDEMMQDLATLPSSFHPLLVPLMMDHSDECASTFTQLISNEMDNIQNAMLIGYTIVPKLFFEN